jgi:hypothetical protein
VSELEELLEAAGEKVNPLELESVFQVRMKCGGAERGWHACTAYSTPLFRNSMRMGAVLSPSTSSSTPCTSAG